jgi:hypothetical protein
MSTQWEKGRGGCGVGAIFKHATQHTTTSTTTATTTATTTNHNNKSQQQGTTTNNRLSTFVDTQLP